MVSLQISSHFQTKKIQLLSILGNDKSGVQVGSWMAEDAMRVCVVGLTL